jgi:hypothetical protein
MDFVAKEDVVLTFIAPAGIRVRVIPGMVASPSALTGLFTKLAGISPKVSGIYSSITTLDHFKGNSLGN